MGQCLRGPLVALLTRCPHEQLLEKSTLVCMCCHYATQPVSGGVTNSNICGNSPPEEGLGAIADTNLTTIKAPCLLHSTMRLLI